MWLHMPIFPYLLYKNNWIEDVNEPVFQLALILHELTKRITAERFRTHDIEALDELIIEYLDKRKTILEEHPILFTTLNISLSLAPLLVIGQQGTSQSIA